MRSRIVDKLAKRRRAPGATLIKNDNPIAYRIKKPAMLRRRTCARPAVKKQNGSASRIARLFPIQRVTAIDRKLARFKWLDSREEIVGTHG